MFNDDSNLLLPHSPLRNSCTRWLEQGRTEEGGLVEGDPPDTADAQA